MKKIETIEPFALTKSPNLVDFEYIPMNKKKILVVDDVEILRVLLKHTIECYNPNYEVTIAANGRTALEALGRESFDVVLTDYTMNEINGLELAEKIRYRWPEMPMVLLSGDGIPVPGELIEKYGFRGFCKKALPFVDMLELIDRLVQRESDHGSSPK